MLYIERTAVENNSNFVLFSRYYVLSSFTTKSLIVTHYQNPK